MTARADRKPSRGREAGQREDVESDVAGEDRVRDPERRPVDHPEHQVPGRGRGEAGQEAEAQ